MRQDVERRLLARMQGAVAASRPESDRSAPVTAGLLVGLDFAAREGFLRLLGDRRAALAAIADGAEPKHARAAVAALTLRVPDGG